MKSENVVQTRPVAIIPCLNEAPTELKSTIAEWSPFCKIILVDDGSSPAVRSGDFPGVTLLRHDENRGQGAAIRTGLAAALDLGAVLFLTVDADGQHPVSNLETMLRALKAGEADMVFGSRFLKENSSIPVSRYYLLKLAKVFNNFITGLVMTDAHNGLRAMNRKGAETLLGITEDRMAHASEIPILVRKNKIKWVEVPVKIRYTEYSIEKGQSFWQIFPLVINLLRLKLKYVNK